MADLEKNIEAVLAATPKPSKLSRIQKRILVTAREYGSFLPNDEYKLGQYGYGWKSKRAANKRIGPPLDDLVNRGLIEEDGDGFTLTDTGRAAAADMPKTYLPASLR